MRLIDADALIADSCRDCPEEIRKLCKTEPACADMKFLFGAPTVDAVEVLRCRECKYWGDEDGKLQRSDGVLFARCKVHNYLIDGRHTGWCPAENDFCSYGERRGGDEDG